MKKCSYCGKKTKVLFRDGLCETCHELPNKADLEDKWRTFTSAPVDRMIGGHTRHSGVVTR